MPFELDQHPPTGSSRIHPCINIVVTNATALVNEVSTFYHFTTAVECVATLISAN